MKKAYSLYFFILSIFFGSFLYSQTVITFDNQGWSNDQKLSSNFSIDNLNFSSNENFYTNYGYKLDVNSNSLYFVFQSADTDKIIITAPSDADFNLDSLDAYQVSESSTDTLIIEGWNNAEKLYSRGYTDVYSWQTLRLNFKNINKIIIRIAPPSGTELTDYNFDNFAFSNTVTQTDKNASGISTMSYKLSQNYPNPFNPSTTIDYRLQKAGNVIIKVYDMIGKEVATLVDMHEVAGSHSVRFNADNLASGIYIYELRTKNFVSIKKMILMK